MAKDLHTGFTMRFTKAIGFLMALILISAMVCPAAAAVQTIRAKANDHCSSEKQPDQNQKMQCCCDQDAISVQQVRAPYEVLASSLIVLEPTPQREMVFSPDHDDPPYLKTGDHLAKLSTLRL